MINKIFLTSLLLLSFSISFAQKEMVKPLDNKEMTIEQKKELKKNTNQTIDFFQNLLKLDKKQLSIFSGSIHNYVNDIQTARIKSDSKKKLNAYVMRFTERRDKVIKDLLGEKKFSHFKQNLMFFDHMTLKQKFDPQPVLDAVDYFNSTLKLDPTQKRAFLSAFSRYMDSVSMSRQRAKSTGKPIKGFDKTISSFAERRDVMIQNAISSKQYKKYLQLINNFDSKTFKKIK